MDDELRLVGLASAVRRALQPRTSDSHLIEDISQETMVRVAAAQHQLEPGALQAYAIVTARNLLVSHHRREDVAERHAHRVVDYTTLAGAEELTLEREETNALAQALDALDEADRRILLDHEANDLSVASLAARDETTPGAMAMRLARSRAILRLEFLLAFRRVTLPTDHCRQVLLAMSAGDQRRQVALDASGHLISCDTCSQLSQPLVERSRGAAAWWFLPIPAWLRRGTTKFRSSRTIQAATATVIVVAVAGCLMTNNAQPTKHAAPAAPGNSGPVASTNLTITSASTFTPSDVSASTVTAIPPANTPAPSPAIAPSATTTTSFVATAITVSAPSTATPDADAAATSPVTATTNPSTPNNPATGCLPSGSSAPSEPVAGCSYVFAHLTVTEVPADEGFWVTYIDGAPMWVHLQGNGESPEHIRPGQTITITATITTVAEHAHSGAPPSQTDRLAVRGVYLTVRFADLIVDSDS